MSIDILQAHYLLTELLVVLPQVSIHVRRAVAC